MAKLRKQAVTSNIYTAMLALAVVAVFVTAVFVAYKCSTDYGTIFTIAEAPR